MIDKILIAVFPAIAVVIDAYTDGVDILNVKHLRGIIIYFVGVGISYSFFLDSIKWYHLLIIPILTRAALFDPVLNLMTGNNFVYNGDRNNPKRSWVDRFEDWTGLSIFWLRIAYLVIYVGYLIYFFIW